MKYYKKKFRVKCSKERNSKYYTVFIFEDLEKMRIFGKTKCFLPDDDYIGLCYSFDKLLKNKKTDEEKWSNEVGYILLSVNYLGAGVTSHECCHAARYYLERFSAAKYDSDEYDELFAWTQGYLVSQIVRKLYNYKFYI